VVVHFTVDYVIASFYSYMELYKNPNTMCLFTLF